MSETTQKSLEQFMQEIQNDNADVRYTAWSHAGEMDVDVIAPLAALVVAENPGVARAASEALTTLAHASAASGMDEKRKRVCAELLRFISPSSPAKTRTQAFRLLAFVAEADAVPALAPWLHTPDVREEAVYALERIPGPAAARALLDALHNAAEEFRPRLLAALKDRRKDGVALDLYEMYQQPDFPYTMPAMKTLARIGAPAEDDVYLPDLSQLDEHDQRTWFTSVLEYADRLRINDIAPAAARLYKMVLERASEPHFHCAAVIGLGQLPSTQALDPILNALGNDDRIVCDSACKALVKMKGDGVDAALDAALKKAEGDRKETLSAILRARKQ